MDSAIAEESKVEGQETVMETEINEDKENGGKKVEAKKKRGKNEVKKSEKDEEEKKPAVAKKRTRETDVSVETKRPVRARKTVERFASETSPKSSTPKPVSIAKGHGTQLKDIPNVAFKFSKHKADENLQLLHTILYGKRAKPFHLKKNILQFSGFVWAENEEKQKAKVKEKIDKCVKDKLFDFCEILDIPVFKTITKKEDLSGKLFEFLESPHATREESLAEKNS